MTPDGSEQAKVESREYVRHAEIGSLRQPSKTYGDVRVAYGDRLCRLMMLQTASGTSNVFVLDIPSSGV